MRIALLTSQPGSRAAHAQNDADQQLRVAAPSGLAGNLIATALVRIGLDPSILDSLPGHLGLTGFETVWDEYEVCDGHLARDHGHRGTAIELAALVRTRLAGPAGALAGQIATNRFRYEPDGGSTVAEGEVWCDTAFDVAAVAVGLTTLGLGGISVYGPLPTTVADHLLSRTLLTGWAFAPCPAPVELVTPTAAAILATCGRQLPSSATPATAAAAEIRGRFVRLHGLAPVTVWSPKPPHHVAREV